MQTGLRIPTPVNLSDSRDWENQFHVWGSPPGKREQNRLETAVREVRAALRASPDLRSRSITVFVQGSYRNRVNVREDSDVDVAVVCNDFVFTKLPEGTNNATFDLTDGDYPYHRFKREVGEALIAYFGHGAVTPGNKAFDVKALQRQVEADVAPFFEHRRYAPSGRYEEGVELRPDQGRPVINWPEQHYENGVDKHGSTHQRFKKVVRILKCLRNEMDGRGIVEAKVIPSFLIECLVFNAADQLFGNEQWGDDVVGVLEYLRHHTSEDRLCNEWGEVSELKYLFRTAQKWTRQEANAFIKAAEAYISR